jgi:hypothetical protein
MGTTRRPAGKARRKDGRYVAVIADLVQSRTVAGPQRRDLQRRIEGLLREVNRRHASAVAASFLITLGDEFQGLLADPLALPDIIRTLEIGLPSTDFRLGIGCGQIHTDMRDQAIGMDGPAWHAAREAIEAAKAQHRLGGVFVGFGPTNDTVLGGFARILHHVRAHLTRKQRDLLQALLEDQTQKEVAERVGVSKQAISKQARAAGWEAYREAEAAWRTALAQAWPAAEAT